jgi:hypothetical protein
LRRTIVFLCVMIATCGCRDADVKAIESKCDASLRQRAEGMARAQDTSPLDVLGKADGPIDDSRRRKLSEAGADLGQVTDELFTARIPAHKLGSVARLGFVKSLQLSQEREPLKP